VHGQPEERAMDPHLATVEPGRAAYKP
jgi:hypothetical protein